jgi:hypothetical protein
MLADDGLADELDRALPGGTTRDGTLTQRAYADAVLAALERPIRDYFPSRALSIGLVLCGGLALVGTLAAGHMWSVQVAQRWDGASPHVLNLASQGNASGWLAAVLMALAGLTALYLYALRRHRVDDYHGRYRVWLWTALACLTVSFGEATSFVSLTRDLCDYAARASNVSPSIAWLSVTGAILSIMGLRLLIETWRCRAAVAMFLAGGTCVLVAAATANGWSTHVPPEYRLLAVRGCWLAAYVFLLTMFLGYARYVVLEIEGKVAVKMARVKPPKSTRAKKSRRDKQADAKVESPRKNARTDLEPANEPVPALKLSSAYTDSRPDAHEQSRADGEGDSQRKLSRKERRRLRRAA